MTPVAAMCRSGDPDAIGFVDTRINPTGRCMTVHKPYNDHGCWNREGYVMNLDGIPTSRIDRVLYAISCKPRG